MPDAAGAQPGGTPKTPMGAATIACLSVVAVVVLLVVGVGVYGYVAATKFTAAKRSSEVRSDVRDIAHAQFKAFQTSGKLCTSAHPVPASIPAKTVHTPSKALGVDFQQGTPTEGWPCLKFEITGPVRFQYDFRVGGGYKGPARGGPDPGPDGFEASAEGDLDGDGKTSLYTQPGRLDKATNTLVIEGEVFAVDEGE